jgi:hypothetical protein
MTGFKRVSARHNNLLAAHQMCPWLHFLAPPVPTLRRVQRQRFSGRQLTTRSNSHLVYVQGLWPESASSFACSCPPSGIGFYISRRSKRSDIKNCAQPKYLDHLSGGSCTLSVSDVSAYGSVLFLLSVFTLSPADRCVL